MNPIQVRVRKHVEGALYLPNHPNWSEPHYFWVDTLPAPSGDRVLVAVVYGPDGTVDLYQLRDIKVFG